MVKKSAFTMIELIFAIVVIAIGVLSLPTMLVFMDGREFVREGRNVSLHHLTEQFKRPYAMMTE